MKLHIKHGRLVDPKHGVDRPADLFVGDGRVAGIGAPPKGFSAERVIDASGLVVAPGLVDLAARLREPGLEYKATLESEMLAAVAGGVTSLACPPDTDPPLDEPGLVEMLKRRAASLNLARVYPVGALTAKLEGERLTEMAELRDHGCVAFSQADVPLPDTQLLWRALQYAATFGFPVWLRPQDPHLAKGGVAHDGEVATRLGLPGIPAFAETIALGTILALVRVTGTRVHLCRLSAGESIEMVRAAKREGLPVTCDVAAHHLHLSDMDLGYFDAHAHVVPPFRSQRDRDRLRAGLADGTIDAVCSDHTPVDEDAKQLPFGESEPGTTGLELLLPLTLKWSQESRLPLPQALARVTSDPARILGLDAGHLAVGAPADVCIFDPESYFKVAPATLRSQGKNTPFLGYELPGVVRYTLVAGEVRYEPRG
ncbi:MAG TPA: dihydroorotase [Burkholderiales bacterium]|nr:dihydroorotase [Burkholderiales bacterium]